MQTQLMESAGTWDSGQGAFISSRHQRLAELLQQYNRNFSVVWVPPKDRDETVRFPFAILDSTPGIKPYVMRYLTEEQMQDPGEILAWIFEGDLSKHRPVDVLERLDLRERAERLLVAKKHEEVLAEERDKLDFLARTPLHSFTIGKKKYRE